jgi:hypothetical protein
MGPRGTQRIEYRTRSAEAEHYTWSASISEESFDVDVEVPMEWGMSVSRLRLTLESGHRNVRRRHFSANGSATFVRNTTSRQPALGDSSCNRSRAWHLNACRFGL